MLAKLLKYEWKATSKILWFISLASLFSGAVICILLWLLVNQPDLPENMAIIFVLVTTLLGSTMFVPFICAFVSFLVLCYRFYRHHFTDEGYLTFTIPASTTQILWASILNFTIWTTISGIVTFVSYALGFMPLIQLMVREVPWNELKQIFDMIQWQEGLAQIGITNQTLVIYGFACITSGLFSIILPFASITIGCTITKKFKLLVSVAIYFGINMALSTISGVVSTAITLATMGFNTDFSVMTQVSSNTTYLIISLISLAGAVGGYFLTHYLMRKKLNL